MSGECPWLHPKWVWHGQMLLNSYEKWLGRPLLERTGDPVAESEALFRAPFVVVSHNPDPDPLINYGNAVALALWEMPLEEFLGTPSRKTAEAPEREERTRMLDRSAREGYIGDYSGVRVSALGRRFRITGAVVWNLMDEKGILRGQAASFREWHFLESPGEVEAAP